MFTKKGFTLIEMVVVGALIAVTIGSWIFLTVSSKKMDKKVEQSQEYYRLLVTLQSTLKRDIRSALHITKDGADSYHIEVIKSVSEEGPETINVIYKKEKDGKVIHRLEGDKEKTYDFSQFPDNDNFFFELVIPVENE